MHKDISYVQTDFEFIEGGEYLLVRYKSLSDHMIFYVKMVLIRKGRSGADAHKTSSLTESTYAWSCNKEISKDSLNLRGVAWPKDMGGMHIFQFPHQRKSTLFVGNNLDLSSLKRKHW